MEFIGAMILVIMSGFIGPTAVEYIKIKLSKKDNDPVKRDLVYSTVISEELEEIREKLDADRIWIGMFHNGGHFLHGAKSMQKISVMHENTKAGVLSNVLLFNNIPVSLLSRSIIYIINEPLIKIVDVSEADNAFSGLTAVYDALGVKSGYVIGLFDIVNDSLLGLVGVDFNTLSEIDTEDSEFLILRAQRLAGYISNFIKS
jgi:hypothetical protein